AFFLLPLAPFFLCQKGKRCFFVPKLCGPLDVHNSAFPIVFCNQFVKSEAERKQRRTVQEATLENSKRQGKRFGNDSDLIRSFGEQRTFSHSLDDDEPSKFFVSLKSQVEEPWRGFHPLYFWIML